MTLPGDLRELVRGQEQAFLERMVPVVRRQSVSLDLGCVERIDAAGIAALISLYSAARSAGHNLTVSNVPHRVTEILALVGLDRILLSQNTVPDSQSGPCFERPAA
jgi:anti-anti-sigma factor